MGIRRRLLVLSVGIVVPLTIVGLAMLWGLWKRSRSELDHSIQEQSALAAVAFEKWLDGQRQPLLTLAAVMADQKNSLPSQRRLSYVVNTRPHWIDLHILDASSAAVREPDSSPNLPIDLRNSLLNEIQQRNSWTVGTDWSRGEGHPVIALAVPIQTGGMIVARIDGAAMAELFRSIELSDGAIIAVFDSERRVLYRSSTENAYFGTNRSGSPLFASLGAKSNALVEATSPYDGIRRVYGLRIVSSCDCVVAVGVPSAKLYSPARKQITTYLIISCIGLLFAISAAVLIAQRIARPISSLRHATKEFGAGKLSSRARVRGGGELEELGATFDEMAEKIETRTLRLAELDRLKSEFIGGVSHELRTPLTTIKTLARVLERGGETPEERREYLETISAECDRQIDLVLNLLDLSRIEAGKFSLEPAKVDVTKIVRNCAAIERHAAEMHSQTIEVNLPPSELFALADESALRRVICGLIENSIKYTRDGGEIILSADLHEGEALISIRDNGCGIRTTDLPHIFEKFYRGRPFLESPNGEPISEAPGVGLGLYLAQTLVKQFGGSIAVESANSKGTIFTVRLRALEEPSPGNKEVENVKTASNS